MMWRGTVYSTLLHGGIMVAVLVGIPVLPKIFDRNSEIETGSSEQSISIEIVSADDVDLRQNVIAPDAPSAKKPAPASLTGALQPLVRDTTEPGSTDTQPTPAPATRTAKMQIPDGALNRPQSKQTSSNRRQAQLKRQIERSRRPESQKKAQPVQRAAQNNRPLPKAPPAPTPAPVPVPTRHPSRLSDSATPVSPKTQTVAVGTTPTVPAQEATSSTAAKISAAKTSAAPEATTIPPRGSSRKNADENEFTQAVRGRKRELVVEVLEADTRLRQAVTPRPKSVNLPEQARTRTLQRLRKSASAGFPHAQYNLAGKYLRGEDLPKDSKKALNWLTRAAQQGYLPAQTLLGLLRFTGLGVPQDQAEAAFWWSLAADGGDDGAKIGTELIQNLLKPRELVKSKRLRVRWGSLITDLADMTPGNTNRRDLDDQLREASEQGDFDAVLSLLASGADADEAGDEGRNAVINAAWRGRGRIIQLLLERGVATELPDDGGRTPLMWAAINGHTNIVNRLVESGANPNQTDRDGSTALIRAAWNGHTAVISSLIAAGADVNLRDDNGLTALAHARREGNTAIAKALRAAGGR